MGTPEGGAPGRIALALAAGRMGLGVVALVVPRAVAKPWIGDTGDDPLSAVLARALGGRDLALGLGALLAWRRDEGLRGWVRAGVLADLVDASVTLLTFSKLPKGGRVLVLVGAGGAAVIGTVVARSL